MENQYGISIKNKYDLFLDNDDPLEILKLQEQKLAEKKADKTKKSSPEKDSKSTLKVKQPKVSPTTPVTETNKTDKSEVSTAKSEDKQRRTKQETNESRLLKDQGNKQATKDEVTVPDAIGKLEIGTFESQTGSGAPREKRGRGRGGFGGGFRGNNERSPREGFDGGNDRRPPRTGGFGRPRNMNFKNNENQENTQLQDDSQGGEVQGFKSFRSNQSDDQQTQSNFSRERHEDRPGEERRGGFRGGRRGFRTFNGEHRGFGNNRRNFENDGPRRNQGFRNGSAHDENSEINGTDEKLMQSDQQDQEQKQTESFGHWGAENETGGDSNARNQTAGGGGFSDARRGFRGGFGNRRGGRSRGRGGFDGRREFNRRGGSNEGGAAYIQGQTIDEYKWGFGIKPVDKRDGTGSHNWGTVMDDLEAQSAPTEENASASWADQAEAAENIKNTTSAPQEEEQNAATEVEPEIQTMTLDEYKAAMEAKRLKAEFNIRKPNEGCADEKWKKTFVLKKKEEEKNDEEEEEETEEERHNKHKNVVPIEIKFSDSRHDGVGGPRTGGGGGGGGGRRGGPRGNYGRGGGFNRRGAGLAGPHGRGGGGGDKRHTRERAPNVADEKDFPSLAATAAP